MTDTHTYEGGVSSARELRNSRIESPYRTFEIEVLAPLIGVEVSGVDLTKALPQSQVEELTQALANHNVLFFRDQPALTPEQQVAFAKRFGDLHVHPAAPTLDGHPEIFVIHTHEKSQVNNGNTWHTDVSCDERPPLATMLQLHKTPSAGGDTLFANMYAAFDALSDSMKNFLRGLSALHESEHVYRGRFSDRGVDDAGRIFPQCEHPVVRTHPVSGRESLYVNRAFTTRIVDLQKTESDALLAFLLTHLEQPQFQVRFRWDVNSIAFWDNRCTQHFALWDYWPEERKGNRVTIQGERPIHRAVSASGSLHAGA